MSAEERSGETSVVSASRDEQTTATSEQITPSKLRYKYDWYQTESEIRVNVLIKKLKREDVDANFQENEVSICIRIGGSEEFRLDLSLAHSINPSKCAIKVYGTKVELRMKKDEASHWGSLERKQDEGGAVLKQPKDVVATPKEDSASAEDVVHKYPSSSHYTRNWDKLVAEVKEEEKSEKPEGDAALNKLFQQIYEGGSDEVKKAMNKSFMESGGTVLSTNWGDIGKKKVERQAPQGMEWKEYDK